MRSSRSSSNSTFFRSAAGRDLFFSSVVIKPAACLNWPFCSNWSTSLRISALAIHTAPESEQTQTAARRNLFITIPQCPRIKMESTFQCSQSCQDVVLFRLPFGQSLFVFGQDIRRNFLAEGRVPESLLNLSNLGLDLL